MNFFGIKGGKYSSKDLGGITEYCCPRIAFAKSLSWLQVRKCISKKAGRDPEVLWQINNQPVFIQHIQSYYLPR